MNLKGLPCPECRKPTMDYARPDEFANGPRGIGLVRADYTCKTCGKAYTRNDFEQRLKIP